MVENCLREDLKPVEQAKAYRALMDLNGWSGNQLAKELGVAQSGVVQALALLALPEPVLSAVDRGDLPASSAYAITAVEDPAEQAELATRAVSEKLSRAEVVKAVRERASRQPGKPKGRGVKPRKVTERTFRTTAGPKVMVEFRKGLDDASIRAALLEVISGLGTGNEEFAA